MRLKTEAKRQAILDVAAKAFAELGYEGASMAEICARVGGSKATIYNYFASKDELFFDVLTRDRSGFDHAHDPLDPAAADVRSALQEFGERFIGFLYTPQIQGNRRLAIGSAGRSGIGTLMYEREVLRSQKKIEDFLVAANLRGALRVPDARLAARQLRVLLEAELIEEYLFQVIQTVTAEDIHDKVQRAVTAFLAIYTPVADTRLSAETDPLNLETGE